MLFKKHLAGILAAVGLFSGAASADVVTFEFTGTVTYGGALASNGSQVKGRFSYDTKTLPSNNLPGYSYYQIPAFKISANVEGHKVSAKNLTVDVVDNFGGNIEDSVSVVGGPLQVDNDFYTDGVFAIILASKPGSSDALAGTDLPSSLDLQKFDADSMNIGLLQKDGTEGGALLQFSIDSVKAIHERRDSQDNVSVADTAGK